LTFEGHFGGKKKDGTKEKVVGFRNIEILLEVKKAG